MNNHCQYCSRTIPSGLNFCSQRCFSKYKERRLQRRSNIHTYRETHINFEAEKGII